MLPSRIPMARGRAVAVLTTGALLACTLLPSSAGAVERSPRTIVLTSSVRPLPNETARGLVHLVVRARKADTLRAIATGITDPAGNPLSYALSSRTCSSIQRNPNQLGLLGVAFDPNFVSDGSAVWSSRVSVSTKDVRAAKSVVLLGGESDDKFRPVACGVSLNFATHD